MHFNFQLTILKFSSSDSIIDDLAFLDDSAKEINTKDCIVNYSETVHYNY